MSTVRYTAVNGRVLSENRAGTKRDYISDSLGSTIALVDNAQARTDTWTYWPYGETRGRTGATGTPYQFVGGSGYYQDSGSRALAGTRYFDLTTGRWTSLDRLAFRSGDFNLYRYAEDMPNTYIDPTGMQKRSARPPTCAQLGFPTTPSSEEQCNKAYQRCEAGAYTRYKNCLIVDVGVVLLVGGLIFCMIHGTPSGPGKLMCCIIDVAIVYIVGKAAIDWCKAVYDRDQDLCLECHRLCLRRVPRPRPPRRITSNTVILHASVHN